MNTIYTLVPRIDPDQRLAESILALDAELDMVSSEGLWRDLQARFTRLCATYAEAHAIVGVEAGGDMIVRRLLRQL